VKHPLLLVLADMAIIGLVICLPFMWIVYTVQCGRVLQPRQYASLLTVTLLGGVFLFLPAISIIGVTGLLAFGLGWISGHYALTGVSYERTLVPRRLFPGDEAQLTVRIRNEKILPLAWFVVTDPFWLGIIRGHRRLTDLLTFSEGVELTGDMEHGLVTRGGVGPFQELVQSYGITALQRGVYALGPARVESGDPFGLFPHEQTMGTRDEIIVYPKVYRSSDIELAFREAIGDVEVRRALLEDPILIAGSREYQPGDPLRRVDWKASARAGELQVRVSDSSTTAQLMVVLNLNTHRHVWEGIGIDRMEEAIRVAASLCVWGLEKGFAVGLHSNGIIGAAENDKDAPRVQPSAHPDQDSVLLEHLARLSFSGRFSPDRVLVDEGRRLRRGTSIIFVTTVVTPEIVSILTSRELTGRASVVYCGSFAAPLLPGIPVHLATPERESVLAVS
jgi:uncharacterized protein (DUF58 family)